MDASDSAVACIVIEAPSGLWACGQVIRRNLFGRELGASSTLREMIGYLHGVRTLVRLGKLRRGDLIEIVGDSKCASTAFLKGGSQAGYDEANDELPILENLLAIFTIASENGFEVRMRWTRRHNIADADALSKYVDRHDFGLRPSRLREVVCALGWPEDALRGPEWVDRFASPHNNVYPRFVCQFYADAVGAIGADAFSTCWRQGLSYVLPDFSLLDNVLDHIERHDAVVLCVVPYWPSRRWWWRLHSGAWADRIVAWAEIPSDSLVAHPVNAAHCFFGHAFDTRLFAFRTRSIPSRPL
jgi:hypothetical protein